MLTIYHPIDCSTPGEAFQIASKCQLPYYLKKGFTETQPTEIPIEVLNKNLMKRLRIEMDYLKEDYGNEQWEIIVQEEYDDRKLEDGQVLDTRKVEFGHRADIVFKSLEEDNPKHYGELSDDYESRIWELYDKWVLEQAEKVKEVAQIIDELVDNQPTPEELEAKEKQIALDELLERRNFQAEQILANKTHKCETCGAEHDGSLGSGRFCSRKCSSTFGLRKSQGTL